MAKVIESLQARESSTIVSRNGESTPAVSRKEVMEDVREVYEREKRAQSIIFRGLGDIESQELVSRFGEICSYLEVGNIGLTNIHKINSNMYRAKISDRDARIGFWPVPQS